MNDLQAVFAQLSEDEARAVYDALAQWVDNEASRDDVDEDDPASEAPSLHLAPCLAVVARCEAVFARLVEEPG